MRAGLMEGTLFRVYAIACLTSSWVFAGTELTNGFVAYENRLVGFELEYPESWNWMDLNNYVVFSERVEDPQNVLRVTRTTCADVSVEQLKKNCASGVLRPQKEGYRCEEPNGGWELVPGPNESCLNIHFQHSEQQTEVIKAILRSVREIDPSE